MPDSAPNVAQQIESIEEEEHELDLAARNMGVPVPRANDQLLETSDTDRRCWRYFRQM